MNADQADLLRRAGVRMLEDSRSVYMAEFAIRDPMDLARCHTVGCIAAHVVMLSRELDGLDRLDVDGLGIAFAATEALGVGLEEMDQVFVPDDWPDDLFERYDALGETWPAVNEEAELRRRQQVAQLAAEAIDRFLKARGFEPIDRSAVRENT